MLMSLFQDFREHNTDTKVHFEISLSEENMAIAHAEGLVKKFKLTTTISTSNMHLFDPQGLIKKYETPEQSKILSPTFQYLEKHYLLIKLLDIRAFKAWSKKGEGYTGLGLD